MLAADKNSAEVAHIEVSAQEEIAMVMILGQHYGDGLVYLHGGNDRILLERAMELGLVSDEGYLTPAGYRFWQLHQN